MNSIRIKSSTTSPGRLIPLGAMTIATLLTVDGAIAQSAGETSLPFITVRDGRLQENGYQGSATRVGKTTQLPVEVPQSLAIVPKELIRDRSNDTLKEALGNVAGLTFNAGEGGRIGDNVNLRGFYSFGDLYLDGIRDVAQYNREVFNVEQVEVLRGSAAMLFGRGQAGGVINQVSKAPLMTRVGDVSATLGTSDYKRATADINRVIGENAALRVNLMKTDAGSTRDFVRSKREGIAPVIGFGIGTRNEFTLGHYYLKTESTPDYGVPFFENRPLDVPASRFYGTRSDLENNITNVTTASYVHRFSPRTELRSVLRAAHYSRHLWANQPQYVDPATVARSTKSRGGDEIAYTSQTDFTTTFQTGPLKHEALLGLEILKERAGRWSYAGGMRGRTEANAHTSLREPSANVPAAYPAYGNLTALNPGTYSGLSIGAYAQDTIEFAPGWKALAGLRQDRMEADYQLFRNNATTPANLKFSETSYRAGLMYQPRPEHNYYFGFSDSFNPTADLYQLSAATPFPAERSKTLELGAKWELLNGDLSLRTALYRAQKEWERNTDIESNASILSRKRHTDGLEFELAGRITPKWEVFGGVALMRAVIDEQAPEMSPAIAGMRPRNAPPYTFNLWTTYKLNEAWKVGGGVLGVGRRLAYGVTSEKAPNPNTAPSYQRVDAMVSYEQPRYSVRLNVLNLLNRRYYESVYDNGGHAVPGTGRSAQLTGTFHF